MNQILQTFTVGFLKYLKLYFSLMAPRLTRKNENLEESYPLLVSLLVRLKKTRYQ